MERLIAALTRAGITARRTREPGGSENAEAIRHLLLEGARDRWDAISEALLLYAARRDHVCRHIEPALKRGEWVVCDRFADSTIAYQGYGRGLPLAELRALHRFTLGDFQPDVTLILDLSVDQGLTRASLRPEAADRFERLDRNFHERLRKGFREIAAANPQRCVVIDAAAGVDAVHRGIVRAISSTLGVAVLP